MADWIAWILILMKTVIDWLFSIEILGVPFLWVVVAFSLLGLFVRSFLIRP